MQLKTKKVENIAGEIVAPSSKSHTQRAIALAILNQGKTVIYGLGFADDEKVAINIAKQLNTKVEIEGDVVVIISDGKDGIANAPYTKEIFSVGESGLSARMFSPILALKDNPVQIIGEGSIVTRPMSFFSTYLPELNVDISTNNDCLPLDLCGPLTPQNITVDGSFSSQYITGLIYAFVGAERNAEHKLKIDNPKSVPYIHLSLNVLKQFGIDLTLEDNKIKFQKELSLQGDHKITLEGDWSGMAFFAVLAAVGGKLRLTNLSSKSSQADVAILEVLKIFGANIQIEDNGVVVEKNQNNAFYFDATNAPDLFPPLAVLALFSNGESKIKGIHRLTHKESNRATGIQSVFAQLGVKVALDEANDEMIIEGGQKVQSATVDSLNDHRIAMALAVIGAISGVEITIKNAEAINKSFPSFYEKLGF